MNLRYAQSRGLVTFLTEPMVRCQIRCAGSVQPRGDLSWTKRAGGGLGALLRQDSAILALARTDSDRPPQTELASACDERNRGKHSCAVGRPGDRSAAIAITLAQVRWPTRALARAAPSSSAANTALPSAPSPTPVSVACWPLRCKFGRTGASAGRSSVRLQLSQVPVSTARLALVRSECRAELRAKRQDERERRFARARRTSTRTRFPLAAVLTTPSNLAPPLAVLSGRSQSRRAAATPEPVLVSVVRGANALQAMPHFARSGRGKSRCASVQLGRLEAPLSGARVRRGAGASTLSVSLSSRCGGDVIRPRIGLATAIRLALRAAWRRWRDRCVV
jgi:hypothetical protein